MKLRLVATAVSVLTMLESTRATAPIELELATQQGVQITAPQEWLQLFAAINMHHVRIRGAQAGDEPTAENRGTVERPRYHVLGILTRGNQLQLPGGTFSRGDRAAIQDYFERLMADGIESLTATRGRFGLTPSELKAVVADLTQPIDFETKGQLPQTVLERLEAKLSLKSAVDRDANAALRTAKPVADELRGVSIGTGAAMMLRSCGLALRPEKRRGQGAVYRIVQTDAGTLEQSTLGKESEEHPKYWPIGWEPDAAPVHIAPSLFEQLNAEIDGYTLAETLAAIGPRVKLPLYVDHGALAADKIDPATIPVKLPRTRTTYQQMLRRVLAQARLGTSLRVDEAGRPFVWITR